MSQAGFLDFLQMLFGIFLVLIVVGYLLMLLFPFILKILAKKMMRKFQNSMNIPTQEDFSNEEPTKKPKRASSKVVGEYIDFEEIK